MKIRDVALGKTLDDIELTEQELVVFGDAGYRVADSILLQRLFARIWYSAYDKGRAYDPRNEAPRDPDGLVGPSDAETIGCPWCPWCRGRAHFGACKKGIDDANG